MRNNFRFLHIVPLHYFPQLPCECEPFKTLWLFSADLFCMAGLSGNISAENNGSLCAVEAPPLCSGDGGHVEESTQNGFKFGFGFEAGRMWKVWHFPEQTQCVPVSRHVHTGPILCSILCSIRCSGRHAKQVLLSCAFLTLPLTCSLLPALVCCWPFSCWLIITFIIIILCFCWLSPVFCIFLSFLLLAVSPHALVCICSFFVSCFIL